MKTSEKRLRVLPALVLLLSLLALGVMTAYAEETFPVKVIVSTWDKKGNYTTAVGGTASASPSKVKRGGTITVTPWPHLGYYVKSITFGDGISAAGFQHGTKTSAVVPNDFSPATEDHAVIVDVVFQQADLPTVIGVKAHVTGIKLNKGKYYVKTGALAARFEDKKAPVTLSTSYLYTDRYCSEALTTAPAQGKPYYFIIDIDAYMDGEPETLVWADNDFFINTGSDLTAELADLTIVELAHSPGGGSISLICRYTRYNGAIKLPSGLTKIPQNAFAGIKAEAVVIPKSVTDIAGDPFAGSGVRYILGYAGSAAQTLADTYGYSFVVIDDAWLARH